MDNGREPDSWRSKLWVERPSQTAMDYQLTVHAQCEGFEQFGGQQEGDWQEEQNRPYSDSDLHPVFDLYHAPAGTHYSV